MYDYVKWYKSGPDPEVKGQRRKEIVNVYDTSSHDNWPMCQIRYTNVEANKSYMSDRKTSQNPYKLDLSEVKGLINVLSGSWMFATHCLKVILPGAKYDKLMSKQKTVTGRTRICTDRRTDRQSDSYIPFITAFTGRLRLDSLLN